jgi:glycerol-3-phosphate dehydrogenase
MTTEEQAEACRLDPLNGRIICRCEDVTEAEIRRAIRRPVGARSVDAVKRRTRAGMGRCQGGFCAPRVMEILADELGVSIVEITKNGGNSYMLTGTLEESLKQEAETDA